MVFALKAMLKKTIYNSLVKISCSRPFLRRFGRVFMSAAVFLTVIQKFFVDASMTMRARTPSCEQTTNQRFKHFTFFAIFVWFFSMV